MKYLAITPGRTLRLLTAGVLLAGVCAAWGCGKESSTPSAPTGGGGGAGVGNDSAVPPKGVNSRTPK